jgi:superfamily II DNA or RNA helicase
MIAETERRLSALDQERAALICQLEDLRGGCSEATAPPQRAAAVPAGPVTKDSSTSEKLALFRRLFRGREDVYARRWESLRTGRSGYQPACRNEWVSGLCGKPKTKCADCAQREFLPVTDDVIRHHLMGFDPSEPSAHGVPGDLTIGVYPLLLDETCWFLAADFDEATWETDAVAFLETCRAHSVPAGLERSRSGQGGHVWIFFAEPVPASLARKLGSFLLTKTMERRPEIGLDSYDRFFPNQNTLPQGGFGSLIALPLQRKPREQGNSLFVDDGLVPYEDQLAFLSSLHPMSLQAVASIVEDAQRTGQILGVRMAVTEGDEDEPWMAPPSRRTPEPTLVGPFPQATAIVLGNQVYVPKEELPLPLVNRLIRLAVFQNPEFYKAQAMRLSTFGKPRIISCAENYPHHIALPRGCLEEVVDLFQSIGVKVEVRDEREGGQALPLGFQGTLRPDQEEAFKHLAAHDFGVLAATTAFGKTVVAARLIAERGVSTLILVHRQQLLDQWVERLSQFLGLEPSAIGQVGAGKRRPRGSVDVALMQGLCRKGVVDDVVAQYGHLVIDECHHLPAVSFELVARASKARYITGLSATAVRKDGHHPIIFMQCGPIRHRVGAREQAGLRPFDHRVIVRETALRVSETQNAEAAPTIHGLDSLLLHDEARNEMIVGDVLEALSRGRSPVVLTERREHLDLLVTRLEPLVRNLVAPRGGMGVKQRRAVAEQLAGIPDDEERVLVATGRYLGEGFDDARLDTLFLTMPISWKGTLAQYAGRLHRLHDQKTEVLIYDYADLQVPMLARMHAKRIRGYEAIGYRVERGPAPQAAQPLTLWPQGE